MAKRYIIKENISGKYCHLSVSKGSFIVRSYENNKIDEKEKGKDNQLFADSEFWKKYSKIGDAPYHNVNNISFWKKYLQKNTEEICEQIVNDNLKVTKSTITKTKIISIIISVFGILSPCFTLLKIDNVHINLNFCGIGYIIICLLIIIFLLVIFVLISRLLKTIITLQTTNKEQINTLKKEINNSKN
jgi:ABC-type bacteriocin/lantibiotic exporter with double-glycine peptidase domain